MPSVPRINIVVAIVVLAVAGVNASGCRSRVVPPPAPTTMRIGVGAPSVGAPSAASSGVGGLVNLIKGDPWFSLRPDGRVSERIALDSTWDEARTTLRIKLRRDVYLHDGTLLTPAVAAGALRASIDGPTAFVSFKSIRDVRGEGDDTVVIELNERNSFIQTDLAGTAIVKPGHPDIGTGPFRIVERQLGSDGKVTSVKLAVFPQYFRGRPPLDGIVVTVYPTQRNSWTALLLGDIDMLYEVSHDAYNFVKAESTVKTYSFTRTYYIPLVFNVTRAPLRDPRIRQAINRAIDRATLVRDGMSGHGSVADGPLWPSNWAYAPPAAPFIYDPDAAQGLLEAAGVHRRATPQSPVPVRLSFSCMVLGNDSRFERIAVLAQKELAEIGIEMRLVPLPFEEFLERAKAGDFDSFLIELAGRSLGSMYDFWRSHPDKLFNSGYRSADAALDRLKAAGSDEEVVPLSRTSFT